MTVNTTSDTFFQEARDGAGDLIYGPGDINIVSIVSNASIPFLVPTGGSGSFRSYFVSKRAIKSTFKEDLIGVVGSSDFNVYCPDDEYSNFVVDGIGTTYDGTFGIKILSVSSENSTGCYLTSKYSADFAISCYSQLPVTYSFNLYAFPAGELSIVPHRDKSWFYPIIDHSSNYAYGYDGGPGGAIVKYVESNSYVYVTKGFQFPKTTILNYLKLCYGVSNSYIEDVIAPIRDSDYVFVEAVDTLPPFIYSMSPISGSTFNDHRDNVEFIVKDYATAVNLVGVGPGEHALNVYVNSYHIIDNGVPSAVCSGTVTLTSIDPDDKIYRIIYNPSYYFDQDSIVVVSGTMEDTAEPDRNYDTFSYLYRIWGIKDLLSSVTASLDTTAPSITNLYPPVSSTNISAGTPIRFNISDDETGVDNTSLNLIVAGEQVLTSGTDTATSGTVTTTGNKYNYCVEYNPDNVFEYNRFVGVTISGSDLHTTPNSVELSYNFRIIPNDMLQIGNIFMEVGDYVEASGLTTLSCEVTDSLYGVDPYNTYFVINGESVTTTMDPLISGSTIYGYKLSYGLSEPYYDGVLCVEVHAQNFYPCIS